MNEHLRWKLVLGCALIAALEIPQGLTLLLQDRGGPYTETVDSGAPSTARVQRPMGLVTPLERPMALVTPLERRMALVAAALPWLAIPTVWSDLRGNRFDLERSTTALALGH